MPRSTWLVAGLVLLGVYFGGYATAVVRGRKQVKDLQHYSDSMTVALAGQVAAAEIEEQRLRDSAQSLGIRRVIIKEAADSIRARANAAEARLATARTAADSVPILISVVTELKHAHVNDSTALSLAEAETRVQAHRGDTLLTMVRTQAAAIANLNQRIHNLTPTPAALPQWVRTGAKVIVLAGTFYAGMQFERQVLHGN